jgi:hypothetical protein
MKHRIIGICKFIEARSNPVVKSEYNVLIIDEVFLNYLDGLSDIIKGIIIEENRKVVK